MYRSVAVSTEPDFIDRNERPGAHISIATTTAAEETISTGVDRFKKAWWPYTYVQRVYTLQLIIITMYVLVGSEYFYLY